MECIASRWRGRKSENPQTRWRASARRASARLVTPEPSSPRLGEGGPVTPEPSSFGLGGGGPVTPEPSSFGLGGGGSAPDVLALDVVIDQTLEFRGEL